MTSSAWALAASIVTASAAIVIKFFLTLNFSAYLSRLQKARLVAPRIWALIVVLALGELGGCRTPTRSGNRAFVRS
jgi:hypothetical protein